MPIEFNKTPGSARKRQRTRAGEIPAIRPSSEAPPMLPTKRIRIIQPIRARVGTFAPGQVVTLERGLANSWIGFGLAEEDKSLDGPPETK